MLSETCQNNKISEQIHEIQIQKINHMTNRTNLDDNNSNKSVKQKKNLTRSFKSLHTYKNKKISMTVLAATTTRY